MSYVTDQDKWIKEVNLQVGDKVLVVASAERYANGWMNSWHYDTMLSGEALEVGSIYQNNIAELGIGLRCSNSDTPGIYGYPFFVLVKLGGKE